MSFFSDGSRHSNFSKIVDHFRDNVLTTLSRLSASSWDSPNLVRLSCGLYVQAPRHLLAMRVPVPHSTGGPPPILDSILVYQQRPAQAVMCRRGTSSSTCSCRITSRLRFSPENGTSQFWNVKSRTSTSTAKSSPPFSGAQPCSVDLGDCPKLEGAFLPFQPLSNFSTFFHH